MAHDSKDDSQEDSVSPPRASNRLMLFAGVAGACALGVGAGLWARPMAAERDPHAMHVAKVVEPEKPTGKLQIVVDEAPAPIGKPIEVLPGAEPARSSFILPPAPAEPDPVVPRRPPEGLVRVQQVTPPAPPVDRAAERLASQQLAERAAKAEQARLEKTKAEKAEKAEQAEAARLEKVRLEKVRAEKARAEKVKLEKVRLEKTERARVEREARAEAKAELAAEQKAARAKAAKLAKARAEKEAAEVAEAKRSSLARLAHAVARAVRHEKTLEAANRKPKAEPVRGEGPLRLASYKHGGSNRCVNADPGAAIVCADPALGAADKRLARAYQEAQAAGVSPDQLKRQQDRWLAARSAAAREAPWAVHDVYLARIAELNDQARDARGGGY